MSIADDLTRIQGAKADIKTSNVYTTACRYNSSGTRAAREYYYTTGSKSYSNGTFTVAAGNGSFAANQTYRLIYVY